MQANETQTSKKPILSPRDIYGHGTHTLSTAGGNFVKGVNVYGFGSGIAKGGSPKARVAAYKACWPTCSSANMLAAFEAAIDDGVDVLSISLGDDHALDYKSDDTAIGCYHANRHGIIVIVSAGNSGLNLSIVTAIAPWIFTVGASTFDRTFSNQVYLGNSTLNFKGANFLLNKLPKERKFYPLIDAASALVNSSIADKASFCRNGVLDPSKVKGKIVVCQRGRNYSIDDRFASSVWIQNSGGVGIIFFDDAQIGDDVGAIPFFPSSHVSYRDGIAILDYINNTANPTAYISHGVTNLGVKPAPMIASFSSRGPCSLRPQILKPDVIAPGVSIIAAYTEEHDQYGNKYFITSGTSMSCPHVAGIAGLLKSIHNDWSPAAIRSAIMTTATIIDNDNQTILDWHKEQATPFGYGSGHINPNAAANPGLIYNLTESNYLDFLCSIYLERDLKFFTPIPYKCKSSKNILDFNYPSITISNFTTSATLKRTVTNVGDPGTYEAVIIAPTGISIFVVPSKLKFNQTGEEKTFSLELKVNGEKPKQKGYMFGSLMWRDGTHNVRSPIVVDMV